MNSTLVIRTLKEALKKQKLTYKDLAKNLGVTEAAIKKQFQSSDISFNRITAICDLLKIQVTDLLQSSNSKVIYELKLTKTQENIFIQNPNLFVLFLQLSKDNGNVEKTNSRFKMDSKLIWSSLKKLDDLALIKLHAKNKVELIYGPLISIPTKNSALEKITHQLGLQFLNKQADTTQNEFYELKISLLSLSKKNAEQLKEDLNRTREFYLRQSEIDNFSLDSKALSNYSLLIAMGEFSFI